MRTLAVISAIISATASPLMATIDVHHSYWRTAFWAMLLSPVNPDGMLVLSSADRYSVASGSS